MELRVNVEGVQEAASSCATFAGESDELTGLRVVVSGSNVVDSASHTFGKTVKGMGDDYATDFNSTSSTLKAAAQAYEEQEQNVTASLSGGV